MFDHSIHTCGAWILRSTADYSATHPFYLFRECYKTHALGHLMPILKLSGWSLLFLSRLLFRIPILRPYLGGSLTYHIVNQTKVTMLPNIPNYLLYFRDDMRLSTWILWGAFFQSLLGLFLPRHVAFLPTATVLVSRLAMAILRNEGFLPDNSEFNVRHGRLTAQIPNEDGSFPTAATAKDIVVFIIATRSNHPKGRFAPGLDEITNYFRACWQDAAANREKWGCRFDRREGSGEYEHRS